MATIRGRTPDDGGAGNHQALMFTGGSPLGPGRERKWTCLKPYLSCAPKASRIPKLSWIFLVLVKINCGSKIHVYQIVTVSALVAANHLNPNFLVEW